MIHGRKTLTRGGPDMSRILPFCRGFLEHLELTLTNETFQVGSLDYYLHIEEQNRPKKSIPLISSRFRESRFENLFFL